MISFAQNFEDVLLERLFMLKKRGFYVDVGAWDPNLYSVTRHFYDRGWRGVNVEPIARRHRMFVEQRKRDVNLLGLVADEAATKGFIECVDADYLSTTVPGVADELVRSGHQIEQYDVDVLTLDAIFDRYCPKVVDFLKIDTEGSEAEVLKTIDLTRHRPRALIIESTVPGSGIKSWDEPEAYGTWGEWEDGVLQADYVFAYFDGLNRFYLRREDSKLVTRLALPPGIYDGIDCTDNWQTRAEERLKVISDQQDEIGRLRERSDAEVAALQDRLDLSECDRAARADVIAVLEGQLAATEQDQAARGALIEQLTAAREEGRGLLVAAEQAATARIEVAAEAQRVVIEGLMGQLGAVERDRASRMELIESLTGELAVSRHALADLGRDTIARFETAANADRIARAEAIGGLMEQLGAAERDRAAHLALIERLGSDLSESRRAVADAERDAAARLAPVEADRTARGEVISTLVEQLGAVERDRAARLQLVERLTATLDEVRKAFAEAELTQAARLNAIEADRIARGELIEGLVNQVAAVERDRAARLTLIEQLTNDLEASRNDRADTERAADARLRFAEADRVAKGRAVADLTGRLELVEQDRAARLALIERLTSERDGIRVALVEAEQAAEVRCAAIESDRSERGRVIDGLVERLNIAERESETNRRSIQRFDVRTAEEARRLEAMASIADQRGEELAAARRENEGLVAQLAECGERLQHSGAVLDEQVRERAAIAQRLADTTADVTKLRRRWTNRLFSFVTGRA